MRLIAHEPRKRHTWFPSSDTSESRPEVTARNTQLLGDFFDSICVHFRVLRCPSSRVAAPLIDHQLPCLIDGGWGNEDDLWVMRLDNRMIDNPFKIILELWQGYALIVLLQREARIICAEEHGLFKSGQHGPSQNRAAEADPIECRARTISRTLANSGAGMILWITRSARSVLYPLER